MRAVHIAENTIVALLDGGLTPVEASQIRAHLDDCADCVALVAGLVKQHTPELAPTLLAEGSGATQYVHKLLAPGVTLGPYVIERLIGSGGMGVVYAARDPRLDRIVALKRLRHEGGVLRHELLERLRRESKALARLSHPNVVTVYELGASGDDLFVAMEYVAGTNLRAWLNETRREPRDVVAKFLRAGRGLAAAHAAGLVHRDFKPDNVLLGSDGSVKVTDFGLARLAEEVASSEAPSGPFAPELTVSGLLVGTPAYMAPEQFTGASVDARADQFAFCVALFEALYGRRPFSGMTVEQLRASVLAGRVEWPRTTRIPPRVRRVLARGLATAPSDRFPTMAQLLAAIAPRRGRLALVATGLAAAATAAVATMLAQAPAQQPCQGTTAEVAAVWNEPRRDAIAKAFAATHAPGAVETWTSVSRGIDSYVAGWAAMHGGACEATRIHRHQSEAVLDLRMACLERRRSELDALLSVFAHADADVVLHAREALASIHDVAPCADVEGLSRRMPLPTELSARVRYQALRTRVDHARALVSVARYAEAAPELSSMIGAADLADFPALDAEANHVYAKILSAKHETKDAERVLFRALVRAQAARADDLVAMAAIDLAHTVGFAGERPADGLRWADFAAAAITGKGGDELMMARLTVVRALIVERDGGSLVESEQAMRKALAIATRVAPGAIIEGEILDGLGANLARQGKLDEALSTFQRSLELSVTHYGPTHSLTASTRMNLANVLSTMHRYDDALTHFREALKIQEQLFGPNGYDVSSVLSNMGQCLQEAGRAAEAQLAIERALAIREQVVGPNHPALAHTLTNLGYVLLDEKLYAQALERFARAGSIIDGALGPDNPARADDLEGTALAHLGLGQPAKAIEPLERALRLHAKDGADPVALASVRAKLAHALWLSGRQRPRAAKLAADARAVLAAADEQAEVAEIDAWLSAH